MRLRFCRKWSLNLRHCAIRSHTSKETKLDMKAKSPHVFTSKTGKGDNDTRLHTISDTY